MVSVRERGNDGNIRSCGKEENASIQDESCTVKGNYSSHTMSHIMDDFKDVTMSKEG